MPPRQPLPSPIELIQNHAPTLAQPSAVDSSINLSHYVEVRHPGYPEVYNSLLQFPALENDGVDYDMVYYACCILTDNCWNPDTNPVDIRDDINAQPPSGQSSFQPRTSRQASPKRSLSTSSARSNTPLASSPSGTKPTTPAGSTQLPSAPNVPGASFPSSALSSPPSDPYLSKSRVSGREVINRPPNGLLRRGTYYFHIPEHTGQEPYPITPSFTHWVFPEKPIPRPWREVEILPIPPSKEAAIALAANDDAIIVRDESCRISRFSCGLEKAYLVPTAEEVWFQFNRMNRFNYNASSIPSIDDVANRILLRADIHHVFDSKGLVIIPKLEDSKYNLVTYILHTNRLYIPELHPLFHNRRCQEFYGVSKEDLFARFAWSIFNNMTIRILDTKGVPIFIRMRILENNGQTVGWSNEYCTPTPSNPIPTFPQARRAKRRAEAMVDAMTDDTTDALPDQLGWYFNISKERMCRYGKDSGSEYSESEEEERSRSQTPAVG
ncbi:hypothetical protein F5Y04DRAFT_245022 [Hypomontagnella monticulosa]|nr:hypothetical protein F5Y04DRAFT_245022 [Hypomontagnella monticulosa]